MGFGGISRNPRAKVLSIAYQSRHTCMWEIAGRQGDHDPTGSSSPCPLFLCP